VQHRDWVAWHDAYARPASSLARRLEVVRAAVARALDEAPPGPLNLVSLCAGDGRDTLPVLATHPRGGDVRARLVELEPALVAAARASAAELGLGGVEVVEGDAGLVDAVLDRLPADLLLVCGVLGNVPPADTRRTVAAVPGMLAEGGVVVWTRGRSSDGAEPSVLVKRALVAAGLEEVSFTWPQDVPFRVGVHRRPAGLDATPPAPGDRLFAFA
jgi:hypothetical protein